MTALAAQRQQDNDEQQRQQEEEEDVCQERQSRPQGRSLFAFPFLCARALFLFACKHKGKEIEVFCVLPCIRQLVLVCGP